MTKTTILSLGVALGALIIATPTLAFADALPPAGEDCAGSGGSVAIGGACSLHDTANTPGTCQNTTCSRAPNPTSCDGGCASVEQPCVLCIAGKAGGDAGPASGGDGGTTGKSSSGGCAVTGSDASPWNMLLPLGLAALVPLALRRRKNKA